MFMEGRAAASGYYFHCGDDIASADDDEFCNHTHDEEGSLSSVRENILKANLDEFYQSCDDDFLLKRSTV